MYQIICTPSPAVLPRMRRSGKVYLYQLFYIILHRLCIIIHVVIVYIVASIKIIKNNLTLTVYEIQHLYIIIVRIRSSKKHDKQLPVHRISYCMCRPGRGLCPSCSVQNNVIVEKPMPRTQTDGQWGEGFNGLAVNKTSNLLLKLSLLWGTCLSLTVSALDRLFSFVFISPFSFRFNFSLIAHRW